MYTDGVGSIPLFGSIFSSKVEICGHRLVTLPLTINETFKWLSSLPILVQNRSSGGDMNKRVIVKIRNKVNDKDCTNKDCTNE